MKKVILISAIFVLLFSVVAKASDELKCDQSCKDKCAQLPSEQKCEMSLKKDISECKPVSAVTSRFDELKGCCCCDNVYNDLVNSFKSSQDKANLPQANYYIALTRYYQLKCLEGNQLWDEYFNQGSSYRDELTNCAQKAIDATTSKEALNVYARLLLWEYYNSQEDVSSIDYLTGLMKAVTDYAKVSSDIQSVKYVADRIRLNGERARSRELYRMYIEKFTGPQSKDEDLVSLAEGFYKEDNLDLAEEVYDIYVDRLSKPQDKEKLLPVLKEIAKKFAYDDGRDNDPAYAEKIFKKLEESGGKGVFDEDLLYLRAYNLEKGKELKNARELYIEFITRFPKSSRIDEALYKIGMISGYALRDKAGANEYFLILAGKAENSPQVISALYHLGLLAQWQEDLVKAKDFYNKTIERAKGTYKDTIYLVQERLKEIEENKPIESNLKDFLDASLKPENSRFEMTKVGLQSENYQANAGDEVKIGSAAVSDKAGCMQVVLEYHWSGNTGSTKPTFDKPGFETKYSEPGTKEIFLVIFSPPDIIDRDLIMMDIK